MPPQDSPGYLAIQALPGSTFRARCSMVGVHPMTTIHGAPSFTNQTGPTSIALTEQGGHLTADFTLPSGRVVSPYAFAPWAPEEAGSELPILLTHLRGDFLCLPFGPQEQGPPHGDTANGDWLLIPGHDDLALALSTTDTHCEVGKYISTNQDHPALYITHRIQNLSGRWSYGSHPILNLSHLPDNAGRVTTSPFRWASTYPGLFSNPENGEHQALAPDAEFTDLSSVPLADGGTTDLTRYPARPGNDDLIMLVNEPSTEAQPFAWTAVVLDGYVWFCLKDPADFPATLFWISNGGRESAPWDSRHTGRLGLEEVCSHFCDAVDVSREDRLADQNIPTTREFHPDEDTSLRLIQSVAEVPGNFGAVQSITPAGNDQITIASDTGRQVTTPLNWPFLFSTVE
jgi:hypothetical protein